MIISRSTLGPSQPPTQCITEVKGRSLKVTTHLHLNQKSSFLASISPAHLRGKVPRRTGIFTFTPYIIPNYPNINHYLQKS